MFYFSKMIRGKLSQSGIIYKKKLNKLSVEIISNIELLYLIEKKNI